MYFFLIFRYFLDFLIFVNILSFFYYFHQFSHNSIFHALNDAFYRVFCHAYVHVYDYRVYDDDVYDRAYYYHVYTFHMIYHFFIRISNLIFFYGCNYYYNSLCV